MIYRRMGKSGIQLSALSLGSWVTFSNQVDEYHADQLMGFAYDNGINFFDNAETYANGESEIIMGRVLKNKDWDRSSYVLSSKAFFGKYGKNAKPNQMGLSRKHLIEACHDTLKRLQTEYLDLYYCHRPDPNVTMEEIVRTMNLLIHQGKIMYWGTSEWDAASIIEANEVAAALGLEGPSVEQPQYNLLERYKIEQEYLGLYNTYGMGMTTWSPLASGLLTGKYIDEIPADSRLAQNNLEWLKEKNLTTSNMEKVKALKNIADNLNVSLTNLSIAWCLKNPNISSVILGASKVYQLEENLKSIEILDIITDEILDEIDVVLGYDFRD